MRRGRDGAVWRENGKVVAVSLGADYCAEHEWGIKGIQRITGIDSALVGLPKRVVSPTKEFTIVTNLDTRGALNSNYDSGKEKMWGLALVDSWILEHINLAWWKNKSSKSSKEELVGHWAEQNFCFMMSDKQIIQEFKDAFDRRDIAIWVGASGPFQNGGLIIAIASRLPSKFVDDMRKADEDRIRLLKAAEDTGIAAKLEKAGKRYYSLSPSWKDKNKKEVIFWLNPQDQDENNYGWMEVKDLEEWIKGKGKIPMTVEQRKKRRS